MTIRLDEEAGVVILRLTGALDHQEMANIKNEINRLLNEGKKRIVLNLKKVTSASLMNIGVLVEEMRLLRSRGGGLKLTGMNLDLCETFNRAGAG